MNIASPHRAEIIAFPGGGSLPRHREQRGVGALVADERGASTAEYAIVTLAAVAFAGLLVAVLRSGEVQSMLGDIIRRALSSA
ncbi:DUF4244 domain-containing protein [Microbacterium sp. Marseille-Q6965]|uniref:DUF4244 domain-containing protein n=1 Tax=Microbacterium sp. Marseille-Q6965 TaxID=2965072 RepID=UPI0021B748CC|nr:DUF4244 domain-containing protein [Microbacterium sp. Marseille-Q6965]